MFLLTELTLALCITSFVFSVLCFYVYVRNKSVLADNANVVEIIKVIDFLSKLCPLGQINHWKLLPYGSGLPRCWHRLFPMQILNKDVYIYGSSILIKAHSDSVFKMISNTSQWTNWIPTTAKKLVIKPLENSPFKEDSLLKTAEVVNNFDKLHSYRFSYLSEEKLGWILFWSVQKVQISFILIQPPESQESNQCLLTFIFGSCSKFDQRSLSHQILFNVNSIKDASEIDSLHVLPFYMLNSDVSKTVSPVDSAKKIRKKYNTGLSQGNHWTNYDESCQNSLKLISFVPYVQTSLPFSKRLQKFELLVNKSNLPKNIASENCEKEVKKQIYVKDETTEFNVSKRRFSGWIGKSLNFNRSLPDYTSSFKKKDNEFHLKRSNTIASTENVDLSLRPSAKARSTSDLHLLTKETLSSITEKPLLENNSDFSEVTDGNEYLCDSNSSFSDYHDKLKVEEANDRLDFEILLPEISDDQIAGIKTKGNYYASKLQEEIHEATSADLNLISEDQTPLSGRWKKFHSHVKGITVLSKQSFSGKLKIMSYICDTEIPVKSSDVWKLIKNPRSRFICDDSVKRVEILQEISSDQKIVYVYHETTNILKKESVDFCLLHTERTEQSKHYLSFCSLEFENCPLMDGMTRGTLLPSGFVVEPCETVDKITKVKYLYQVMVSNPNSQFLHDLNNCVSYYIYNLKNYLLSRP